MYNNWLIELDTIDSTNNYAMHLLQDGLAQNGTVVVAEFQTHGKGQRGKTWLGNKGENIAMSVVLDTSKGLDVFSLSFLVPIAVRKALQQFLPACQVVIKWPNDIYVDDRKLAGILIENVFRGASLKGSVVGIGVNVYQQLFDISQPSPVSLKILRPDFSVPLLDLVAAIRANLLESLHLSFPDAVQQYNDVLYKKGNSCIFEFKDTGILTEGIVVGVDEQFDLILEANNERKAYRFGTIQWRLRE